MEMRTIILLISLSLLILLPSSAPKCIKHNKSKLGQSTSMPPSTTVPSTLDQYAIQPPSSAPESSPSPSSGAPSSGAPNSTPSPILTSILVDPDDSSDAGMPDDDSSDFENGNESSPSEAPVPLSMEDEANGGTTEGMASMLSNTGAASTGVDELCANTDYKDLCKEGVKPGMGATPTKVLEQLIKVSLAKTKEAIEKVKKLQGNKDIPQIMASNLDVCIESYNSCIDDLTEASSKVAKGEGNELNNFLSAALTDVDTCETGFQEMEGISPVADIDEKLMNQIRNCLALSTLIK